MRAIYLPELSDSDVYRLDKDAAHHLINVVRISINEQVLLLDGKGKRSLARVRELGKREVILEAIALETTSIQQQIDIALGAPKKEALELSIKEAQELGIGTLYLVKSQYSQARMFEEKRINALLVSALEQSNASFLTNVLESEWKAIDYSKYASVVLLDSQNKAQENGSVRGNVLLIVGPEGGFSQEEFSFFEALPNLTRVTLNTPILRTPTALATGVGLILGRLND